MAQGPSAEPFTALARGGEMPAALIVESSQPFRVRTASAQFLETFGYAPGQVAGRSVRVLHGPATVGDGVVGIIRAALAGDVRPSRTLAALYARDGGLHLMSVEAGRDDNGTYVVSMARVNLPSAKQAFAEDGSCKMVLAAETRRIEAVSAEFAAAYGFSIEAARGRTANLVQGPGSDPQLLTRMIEAASSGLPQRGKLLTFRSDCSEVSSAITVTAVHDDKEVGRVSHFLITFVHNYERSFSASCNFTRTPSSSAYRSSLGKVGFSAMRLPSVVTPASIAERHDLVIKAILLFLALPTFLRLGAPVASGSVHAGVGADGWLRGHHPANRAFGSSRLRSLAPLHSSKSALALVRPKSGHAPEISSGKGDRLTLVLDLDKTVLYGNDGNDLGVALQWMEKDVSTVKELYKKLVNPNLRRTYDAYVQAGKEVDVVIYTRRPQIVYYKSCVRQNTVPVRYADEWHAQGQLFFPSDVKSSEDIFATYTGPELLEDEQHDVKMSLDRLLAARDAVVSELGLVRAPPVVVTAQTKALDMTARQLHLPVESCLLFDDNTDLRREARVVLVEPLESLPHKQRHEVLAFMQEQLPVETLEQDLVDYLEEARPDERSLWRDQSGKLAWHVPEATHPLQSWRTPVPAPPVKPLPMRHAVSNHVLPLKAGAKILELRSEPMSNVSPADVPAQAAGQGLIDLRAAAEKAAFMRELDCDAEQARGGSR